MRKCRPVITLLAFGLPLAAMAAVPVEDAAGKRAGTSTSAGYGAAGAYAAGGLNTRTSAQGELFLQLQQLQEEVSRLRGMVEEQQHELGQLKRESLERYQDIDSRLSAGASAGPDTPASTPETVPAAPPVSQADAEPADPAKEKLYYDAAFDLIKAKDFDKASQAFSAFLRKYPNSQYAGNAQYWLGEVRLVKGDLQDAEQAFAKVSQNYPDHAKVPDSLYKLADVERRLGHAEKARSTLQQVIAQYPGTSAAQLARRDLQNLH